MANEQFEMMDFLPYLLTMAAEEVSQKFKAYYKNNFGMLRTEWRILFHLGRYGTMTAAEIGKKSKLHKTKISRAVAGLEKRQFLSRKEFETDRRQEQLTLTKPGVKAYVNLSDMAKTYNASVIEQFSSDEREVIFRVLRKLSKL